MKVYRSEKVNFAIQYFQADDIPVRQFLFLSSAHVHFVYLLSTLF